VAKGQPMNYYIKVLDRIILRLEGYGCPNLVATLLARCSGDAIKLYDHKWSYFIEVIRSSEYNEALIQVIFNISEYS
jgi:hypothetical protein